MREVYDGTKRELEGYFRLMLKLRDVNILPKKTWEALGKPQLKYYPIQLRMENKYCTFPIGRLEDTEVDLGVNTYT